tara:strand:- start:1149 stop:3323 length:2175 start_codon:yes stop_codon:yes gene_type:complete
MKRVQISFILGLILCASAFAQAQNPLQFEHIFDSSFSPKSVENVRWMKNGNYYTATRNQQVVRYNILKDEALILFDGANFKNSDYPKGFQIQGYEFSSDENKILLKTDVEQIWRRSTREHYYVYDLVNKKLSKLTSSDVKQQFATLSPDGNKAAFVRENNLFWIDLASRKETQITSDGEYNNIINGATDWVYEEEFGFAKAWFWSPNSKSIAFYRFDESAVKEFTMEQWGDLYPSDVSFKYPKAGEENSVVSIHVYNLVSGKITNINIGDETDQYIPRVNWTTRSSTLAIRRMNRLQNKQELLFAEVATGKTKVILSESSKGWLDVHDNLIFLKNGKQFIYTSEKDGYNHVYLYDMTGKELNQITKGKWEVTKIVGFNEGRHNLYYESTEVSPLQRQFYRIRVDGKRKRTITEAKGWHSINLSSDFKYYIDTYSNHSTPPVITLYKENGKGVRTLEDNATLKAKTSNFKFGKKTFAQFDVNGKTLNAFIINPVDFDSTKKYPVLMYVYGGPGSQTVMDSYESGQRAMWHQYLANQGYLVVSVDNRGTGARGRDFEQQTYLQLGKYEIEDQIEVAKQLASKPFIDAERIGIWGWSYGGYMSSLGITEGNSVFSTAIAVAPVTYWGFYDTIYTERFMQTPESNPDGYKNGSPLFKTDQVKGNYLLIHGTGDDNVHFQNSVEMVNALLASNIQFQTMYYPNRNHGISGGNSREHLYQLMTNFILEKL